jgi:hypothetical protein
MTIFLVTPAVQCLSFTNYSIEIMYVKILISYELEVGEDEEMEEEEEPNRDEGGLLAKQKGNLGRSTPPPNDSMDTSVSGASTGSSASASTASQGTDSAASEERMYETRQRTTLKQVGKRLLPSRKRKKLQDDGVDEMNGDDEEET